MEVELGTESERESRVVQLVHDVDEEQVGRLSIGDVLDQTLVHGPEPIVACWYDTRHIWEGHDGARHPSLREYERGSTRNRRNDGL